MPYVFSYFTGNGEDGLHLAGSRDGLTWKPLRAGRPFLAPSVGGKLMRDPCLCAGPDGMWHLVHTTGWWDRGIGVAHSANLIDWSAPRSVPVMEHEPGALNAWAPECVWDPATRRFVVFWASTIPGRFPETDATGDPGEGGTRCNHRMYRSTTTDFVHWSPTELHYDGGFNVIDATLVRDGGRWRMIVKDETKEPVARKHLRVVEGKGPTGPWQSAGPAFTPDWVEGPSVIRVGREWFVLYDAYTRGRYEGSRTRDFKHFESISDKLSFPPGARHGTAVAVAESVLARLEALR
ncbi:MAG: glycoside hydrolase family 43 protein [Armatimonadota bacterium]